MKKSASRVGLVGFVVEFFRPNYFFAEGKAQVTAKVIPRETVIAGGRQDVKREGASVQFSGAQITVEGGEARVVNFPIVVDDFGEVVSVPA
jgi:hypothetical protein